MGIKEEITKIAVEQGYDGAKPKSIAQAIDALTDTLAGEDVKSGRSVVDAIRKYAPYVGSGGGGTERVKLFNETVIVEQNEGSYLAALAYTGDITDNPLHVRFDGVEYELPKSSMGNAVIYGTFADGMPDFSTYPLAIEKDPDGWYVHTETAGTHTIVAYTENSSGGGGGGFEPKGMSSIKISEGILGTGSTGFYAGTNEPSTDGPIIMFNDANVCMAEGSEYITIFTICGGLNVMASLPLASGVDADSVGVFYGDSEVPSTKKVLTPPSGDRVLFIAFKTLEEGAELSIDIRDA